MYEYRLVWADRGIRRVFEIDGPRDVHFYEVKVQSRWVEPWDDSGSDSLVASAVNAIPPVAAEMRAAEDRLLSRLQLSREDLDALETVEL